MSGELESTSKFLSYVLRHKPEAIGLSIDNEGWTSISELIDRANVNGHRLTYDLLKQIVLTNKKKRFSFSHDGTRIRANQGHSIDVDLGLDPQTPPDLLYHGTATRFLDSIREKGLIAGSRQHVHLSADAETAVEVGRRHGKPAVLTVRSQEMYSAGYKFFISDNGVWLTWSVPVEFLVFGTSEVKK